MESFVRFLEQINGKSHRREYFDRVMQKLKATEDDLSRGLETLSVVRRPSTSPELKDSTPRLDPKEAVIRVQKLISPIIRDMISQQLSSDDSVRAKRTLDLLRHKINGSNPQMYLQDLLRELFGTDFYEEFLKVS